MADSVKILCVDDERNVLKALRRLFMDEDDYEILLAESGEEGLGVLEDNDDILLVISDYRMPGMTGVDFLAEVCEKRPETIRIVLSGYADTAAVVEAINEGQIYKFIPKPWNDEELKSAVSTALQHQELQFQNNHLNEELQKKNMELQEINQKLEQLVEERTEALDIRNRVLQVSQTVLDVLSVAIFSIDADGLIVQCNDQAQELIPYGITGPLGHHCQDVFNGDINRLIEQAKDGEKHFDVLEINGEKYRTLCKRLPGPIAQGAVLEIVKL